MNLTTRVLGATGIETTAIGLGGAVITHESEAAGVATVRAALEAGVRYFDTSPGYGAGRSQPVFGQGLGAAAHDVTVATKIGYFDDPADYRRPEAIRAQIEQSLRYLKRDHVDVLQVHEANWSAWWVDGGGRSQIDPNAPYDFRGAPVFEALHQARHDGLCRTVGITGNVADQMTHALRDVDVDTFLIAFNHDLVLRTARRTAIPLAVQKRAAVILGAIFYGARLVAVHPEWIESPPDWMTAAMVPAFKRLYELQRESGLSLVDLSVRFALAQPDVSVVLVGVKNEAELVESLRAAEAGPLPDDLQAQIEAIGLVDP